MTREGKKLYVTFIDDYSRFARIYLLRSKDEAFDMFLNYKAEVENQLDRKIKRIISDRGGEYIPLNDYCEKEGIIHEVTPPYSPESNGVVESTAQIIIVASLSSTWGGSKPESTAQFQLMSDTQ